MSEATAQPGGNAPKPAPTPRPKKGEPRRNPFAPYKPHDGYYTRMLSGVGAGTLVLAGVAWLWSQMTRIQEYAIYWQSGMAVAVIGVFGTLIWYLLNKPRIADFLIATEAEMKKVAWPTRKEVVGATVVVIVGTLFLTLLLFGIDLGFTWIFQEIGILQIDSGAN